MNPVEVALKNAVPIAIGGGVLLFVIYYLSRKTVADVADTLEEITVSAKRINEGTPFEGFGAIGTLGNVTNQALGGIPQAVGERISSWFAPEQTGLDIHYAVLFPDGARHAIHASNVDKNGFFSYGGTRYRIGINNAGTRVAVQQ